MKKIIFLILTVTIALVDVSGQDVLSTEEMNSVFKKEKHHNKVSPNKVGIAILKRILLQWQRGRQ